MCSSSDTDLINDGTNGKGDTNDTNGIGDIGNINSNTNGDKPKGQTAAASPLSKRKSKAAAPADPCVRAENEDDDGYDPYSDRRPTPEPMFERDPWS